MPQQNDVPEQKLIGQRIGRYRITRQLAQGGMGHVFEVVHEHIGHRAAVKLLSAAMARHPKHKEYVQRFYREACAVNIIDHPGIVKIFDFGQVGESMAYIMMELLSGESLWERLQRHPDRRLPIESALRITRQMASALQAAHDKGIVHRDLKPENVILCPEPDSPEVERSKLLDFGIARFLGSAERLTAAGTVMGTVLYMSPEQCSGMDDISSKSDVYALGVMLYEMLGGGPPFSGQMAQVMRMQMEQAPLPLGSHRPELPPELGELAHRMLAKSPDDRPSMAEVVQRIRRLESTRPLAAAEEGTVMVPAMPPAASPDAARPTEIGAQPQARAGTPWGAGLLGALLMAVVLLGLWRFWPRPQAGAVPAAACPEPAAGATPTGPAPMQKNVPKPGKHRGR